MILRSPKRGFLVRKHIINTQPTMKLTNYIKDTRAEIKHVNWPTRSQAIGYTAIVIVLSVAVAFLLGTFDVMFAKILAALIS